jgi:hypothetical protein
MKAIIFGLDRTLLDNSAAEGLKAGQKNKLLSRIEEFKLYKCVDDLQVVLIDKDIPWGIVSPQSTEYCDKVLEFHDDLLPEREFVIPTDSVGEGELVVTLDQAIEKLSDLFELNDELPVVISGRTEEIKAANEAGMETWAGLWGVPLEKQEELYALADKTFETVRLLIQEICQPKPSSDTFLVDIETQSSPMPKPEDRYLKLVGNDYFVNRYALGYRFKEFDSNWKDKFSRAIIDKSKGGSEKHMERASKCMSLFASDCLKSLWYEELKIENPFVIPLIPHKSRKVKNTDFVCRLAVGVATTIKGRIRKDILEKKPHKKMQDLKKTDRVQEIKGKYSVREWSIAKGTKVIVLVDDVVTTGATSNEAARALREAYPEIKVVLLALAQAGNTGFEPEINNKHLHNNAEILEILKCC